jgi:hypothetical protein
LNLMYMSSSPPSTRLIEQTTTTLQHRKCKDGQDT